MFLQDRLSTTITALLRFSNVAVACLSLASATVWAKQEAEPLPPDVANRAPLPCVVEPPPAQAGKSLWATNLWTGGVVPYVYDANTTVAQQNAMRTAMNTLEGVANLHFVERTGQANYLTIRSSTGNNSQVGMSGGAQTVNIFNWNFNYIMCHELMHALGEWHEQSRPDRDLYVTINTGNIDVDIGQCGGSCVYNFAIVQGAVHGPYDFDSIMHYGQNAFSSNGQPTITVLPPNEAWQTQIGQLTHLSTGDIAGLVSRYGAVPSAPWTQRIVTGPTARDGHALAYDAFRGRTVLFGGTTSAGVNAETWEWSGSAWAQRTVTGPTARVLHAMAYDSARHVVVLFGGSTSAGAFNNQTWEWNGTSWTQRTGTGPSGRNMHAMAYDVNRGVTVLFGGATSASARNAETWEWNGTAWTQRSVTGPTGRMGHSMAYDSRRGVCVLSGGQVAGGTYPGDTWEWSGTAWTQRATSGPSARYQQAMAYDPVRAVTALYGGWNGTTSSAENWIWSGTAWAQRTSSGITARYNHAMTYDSIRGVSVLFGGTTAAGKNAETWELGVPCAAPTFSVHPSPQSGCSGSYTATFTVTASSTSSLTYQWRKGGTNIADVAGHRSGCTTPTLTINNAGSADAGSYDCVATGGCGSTTSNPAALAANTTSAPVSVAATPSTICAGSGQSSVLSGSAQGNLIRWYNASTNALVNTPVSPTITTSYYAVANPFSCPSNHSQTVTVTVTPGPIAPTAVQVTVPGDDQYCSPPASITLQAVGASGTTAWRKSEGAPVSGCGTVTIIGGTNGTLVISPAPAVTTTYYARTTSACGESACASLTITVGCPADLGSAGGEAAGDCLLDNNDFIVFIDYFFTGNARADRGVAGGEPGSDGTFDNNDFIAFIDQFFAGCP